jgi:Fe-S cluster assembly ATP-binding protein
MLQIQNISFSAGGKQILNDISLDIPDGKLIALTGPNGGGKTTLAKMIAGVEKPTSGRILLDGEDLVPLDPTQRARRGVSYAFQQPVRFKGITVRDLLGLAAGHALSGEELAGILGKVGLNSGDYVDRAVGPHLSGGEIKRIELAGVLLRDSRVIIFDEPEAGIDLWSFNNLIRVFEDLRKARSCAVIIISHQERILRIADEIVMIQNGRLGLHGDRRKIYPRLLCKDTDCGNCPIGGEGEEAAR